MPVDPAAIAARVRQAIRAAGLTQRALARATDMDTTALSKVLAGKRRLSALELALIAEATAVGVDELLGTGGRAGTRPAPRAQPAANPATDPAAQPAASPAASPAGSRAGSRAVEQALSRVGDFLEIDGRLGDLGLPALPSRLPLDVPAGDPVAQAGRLAAAVRALAGTVDDIDDLAAFCEQRLGIDVAVEPLPPGLDGLSVARGDYRLALVSSAVPATRQRYTLAHEIGHLAAGDTDGLLLDEDLYGRRDGTETRANCFAAALLMPAASLRALLGAAGPTEQSVAAMLARHQVSLDALAFRLHSAGLVDSAGRDRVRRMSAHRPVLRGGHAQEYQRQLQTVGSRRLPTCLWRRAAAAYDGGGLGIGVLARLAGVHETILRRQLGPLPPMTEQQLADADTELVL